MADARPAPHPGHSLHNNGEPINPGRNYHYQNGRSFDEAITVNWQLRDVLPGLGGFACVPGSHRANYRCPKAIQMAEHDPQGMARQLAMPAGAVMFFADGALVHGTTGHGRCGHLRRPALFFIGGCP